MRWAFLAAILPRAITPLATLVLAALLQPSDFGTVAVATFVITAVQVLIGLGSGAAIVQRRGAVNAAASFTFWLGLCLSLMLYGALWMASPSIARLFNVPAAAHVLQVVGLTIPLQALTIVPSALLQREMGFRHLFWAGVIPQSTAAVLSIGLASAGYGVWALVFGQLAATGGQAAIVWRLCQWRPSLSLDWDTTAGVLRFNLWMWASGALSWMLLQGDNVVIGYVLGPSALGVYSLGFNLAGLLPGLLISPMASVAYPAFSDLARRSPLDVGGRLLAVQRLAAVLLFPACFGLAAMAGPVIHLLYGTRWAGLAFVIQCLAIMPGLSYLWSLNADAYRAVGRPEVWVKLTGATLLAVFPAFVFAAHSGLAAAVIARSVTSVAYPILTILAARSVLHVAVREQLRVVRAPFVAAALMFGLVKGSSWCMVFEGGQGWAKVALLVALGIATYSAVLHRLAPGQADAFLRMAGRLQPGGGQGEPADHAADGAQVEADGRH